MRLRAATLEEQMKKFISLIPALVAIITFITPAALLAAPPIRKDAQKECSAEQQKSCQDAGCCEAPDVQQTVVEKPKPPPMKRVCMEATGAKSAPGTPSGCACETEGDVIVVFPNYMTRTFEVSCVANALKVRAMKEMLERLREQMDELKALGDERWKIILGKIEVIETKLIDMDGRINEAKAIAETATVYAKAAGNHAADNEKRIENLEDHVQTGMQIGATAGAEVVGRGDNGVAGGALVGVDLRGRFTPVIGICAQAMLGLGAGQTVPFLVSADLALLGCFHIPDSPVRIGVGPFVKQEWRTSVNRDDRDGLGNDIGFAAGGQLEVGIMLGDVVELAPYVQLGAGWSGGHNPDTGGVIVEEMIFRPSGGLKVNFLTGVFDFGDDGPPPKPQPAAAGSVFEM